jgi:hypothetical protein
MKKCIYCGKEKVHEDSVMDFCDECGTRVWGPKMFAAIKANYTKARDDDDLVHMDMNATLKTLRSNSGERKVI